jgi:hypothetical protein
VKRIAKVTAFAALWAALLAAANLATDDTSHHFMDLLKSHRFREAAEEFYYEPTHTPAEIGKEKADITTFLQKLFLETGDIQRESPTQAGFYTTWVLGVSAGDRPDYSASDVGADDMRNVLYDVQFAREGARQLAIRYAHVHGQWKVLHFEFKIPMSESGGAQRIAALAAKVFPTAGQPSR